MAREPSITCDPEVPCRSPGFCATFCACGPYGGTGEERADAGSIHVAQRFVGETARWRALLIEAHAVFI